jgi:hypothetical protein
MLAEQAGAQELIADALNLRLPRHESCIGAVNRIAPEHQVVLIPVAEMSKRSRNTNGLMKLADIRWANQARDRPVSLSAGTKRNGALGGSRLQ